MSVLRDEYGWEIKKGVVFGFLCAGRTADGRRIYRFGKTTKQFGSEPVLENLDKLNFSGLNKATHVVLWKPVDHVLRAWDLTVLYLRNHRSVISKTKRPTFKHEAQFGANYFSTETETTATDLEAHMHEAFAAVL